jgi:type II secretory pathway pseudopilin PulG
MIRSRLKQPRRGMTVVALLICLILITLISAAILKLSTAQREFVRAQERRLQAEWLVESGVERCLAGLAANRDYAGETWPITAVDLGLLSQGNSTGGDHKVDQAAAVVTITVDRLPDNPVRRRVRVQADYPRDSPRRARHSKQILIDLEPTKAGDKT